MLQINVAVVSTSVRRRQRALPALESLHMLEALPVPSVCCRCDFDASLCAKDWMPLITILPSQQIPGLETR